MKGIRNIEIEKDNLGRIVKVRIVFGPHYFIELHTLKDKKVDFLLGATHHGFYADASEINGELEQIINLIRKQYPEKLID